MRCERHLLLSCPRPAKTSVVIKDLSDVRALVHAIKVQALLLSRVGSFLLTFLPLVMFKVLYHVYCAEQSHDLYRRSDSMSIRDSGISYHSHEHDHARSMFTLLPPFWRMIPFVHALKYISETSLPLTDPSGGRDPAVLSLISSAPQLFFTHAPLVFFCSIPFPSSTATVLCLFSVTSASRHHQEKRDKKGD